MSEPFLSLGGAQCLSAHVVLPYEGVWRADLTFDSAVSFAGTVEVKIGTLTLLGTVDPAATGDHHLSSKVRVVAGAGGWAKSAQLAGYHNDAGVKRSLVAADVARTVGEVVSVDASVDSATGVDFLRLAGTASQVLRQAFPGVLWWVDFAGVTHVGPRPAPEVTADYDVLDYDPSFGTATIATEVPEAFVPGCVVSRGLTAPLAVRDVVHDVAGTSARVLLWGQQQLTMADGLMALARGAHPRAPFAFPYRYRVIEMVGDRVTLQAVRKAAGLPDALAISTWPGVSGLSAELTPGTLVLVEFVEGDPALPIVTHFEPKEGAGFVPVSVRIDATDEIRIGSGTLTIRVAQALAEVLRNGETVNITGVQAGTGVVGAIITVNPATFLGVGPSRMKA